MAIDATARGTPSHEPAPVFSDDRRGPIAQSTVWIFTVVPFVAFIVAVTPLWSWGPTLVDAGLMVFFYYFTGLGVTIGFHRYFTHGSFKARRGMKIALAIAGSMSLQGPILHWVADHRRHHEFSDRDGDPHSPWAFGTSPWALVKGFWHAHMGWLFDRDNTNPERYIPKLLKDPDLVWVNRLFPLWTALTLVMPAVLGGLITWSWWGALTAFIWASLVRIVVLHHVTWSTNSICHMIGARPFKSQDKAGNVWPLAILSFGESWHNLHHADPTSARHGVGRGQLDTSARVIWLFEKFGWVTAVRWPTEARIAKLCVPGKQCAAG